MNALKPDPDTYWNEQPPFDDWGHENDTAADISSIVVLIASLLAFMATVLAVAAIFN